MNHNVSLARLIKTYYGVSASSKEFDFLYLNSVRYLLRIISASEFHRRVKTVAKKSVKKFRLLLINAGYFLLNLKMQVINAVAHRRSEQFDLKVSYRIHEIKASDKPHLERLVFTDKVIRQYVKGVVKDFGGKKHVPTIFKVKETLGEIMEKVKRKITSIVARKLRFIATSNAFDMEDLRFELMSKMVQAYYWMIPSNKTLHHWVMTMIKTLKNQSLNMINYFNAKKRARMTRAEDGSFVLSEISSNFSTSSDDQDVKFQVENMDISDSFREEMELHVTTKQILARYATTAKRSKILKLMMGLFDKEFSAWLRTNRYITRGMDNSDFQEIVSPGKFLKAVRLFVRMELMVFKKFISRLKSAISPVKEAYADGGYYSVAA